MLSIKEYNQSKDVKGFVQKLFESRQIIHDLHLKTKSYSQHVALQEYYTEILEMADDFVETYQGQYGIIDGYEIKTKEINDPIEYLQDCVTLFKVARNSLKDEHLHHVVDEIISLTYKTIYKIKFLK